MNKLIVFALLALLAAGQYDNSTSTTTSTDAYPAYPDTWSAQNTTDTTDYSSNSTDEYDWESYEDEEEEEDTDDYLSFEVNKSKIISIIDDVENYKKVYKRRTSTSIRVAQMEISSAIQDTTAKLILDFGRVWAPIIKDVGTIFENLQVNVDCDQDCAVQCFSPGNPRYANDLYFDQDCLAGCGCTFKYANVTQDEISEIYQQTSEDVQTATEWVDTQKQDIITKVSPSLETVVEKQAELQTELIELIQDHLVNTFGCDETCVADCTNYDFITVWIVRQCINYCYCEQEIFSISNYNGSDLYDYQSLMSYSGYNMQAWSFFKRYQARN